MPATLNPGPRPVLRKAKGWSDYDLLTRRPQDERVAIGSAVLLTILLHGSLLLIIPWHSAAPDSRAAPAPAKVEYALEPLTPEEQQQLMQFIQTNPNAPDTPPPETPNFSARNQVAAQPEPRPNKNSDIPRTQGEVEGSTTFLNGDSSAIPPPPSGSQPAQPSAAAPPPPAQSAPAQNTPPAENAPTAPVPPAQSAAAAPPPLPALLGQPGTGEGINLAETPVESTAEKPPEKPSDTAPTNPAAAQPPQQPSAQPTPPAQPASQPAAPAEPGMERLRVQVEFPPGVIVKNVSSAANFGAEASNAKFSNFGEYLERMFEAVASAWRPMVMQHIRGAQDYGARVVVVYNINQKGEAINVTVVLSTASQTATVLCTNAIKSRSPFGPWTKEMIAQLHPLEEIRITFWYR